MEKRKKFLKRSLVLPIFLLAAGALHSGYMDAFPRVAQIIPIGPLKLTSSARTSGVRYVPYVRTRAAGEWKAPGQMARGKSWGGTSAERIAMGADEEHYAPVRPVDDGPAPTALETGAESGVLATPQIEPDVTLSVSTGQGTDPIALDSPGVDGVATSAPAAASAGSASSLLGLIPVVGAAAEGFHLATSGSGSGGGGTTIASSGGISRGPDTNPPPPIANGGGDVSAPEPASFLLFAFGALPLGALLRRQRGNR